MTSDAVLFLRLACSGVPSSVAEICLDDVGVLKALELLLGPILNSDYIAFVHVNNNNL